MTRPAHLFAGLLLLVATAASAGPRVPGERILVLLKLARPHYRPNASYSGDYGDGLSSSAQRRVAKRIAREHALVVVDDWPMPLLHLDCFVMAVPGSGSAVELAASVAHDPAVEWSEPMHLYHAQAGSPRGDPLAAAQPTMRAWHLAELHAVATGRGVTVAVIDSRIDGGHPDLAGQVATAADFVTDHPAAPEQHGTAVAGIIAAKGDNGLGIIGVAPQARLMGLRACWQETLASTVCDSLSLAKALHFAIEHKAQIINLSLSGPRDLLLEKLIRVGLDGGTTVVAAFDGKQSDGGFPASLAGVIAVSDKELVVPRAGVYTAPGSDVPTTVPGGRWDLVSGSSYSAAQVSGLMALSRERRGRGGGALDLVLARSGSGAIDACATLDLAGSGACPRVALATATR